MRFRINIILSNLRTSESPSSESNGCEADSVEWGDGSHAEAQRGRELRDLELACVY